MKKVLLLMREAWDAGKYQMGSRWRPCGFVVSFDHYTHSHRLSPHATRRLSYTPTIHSTPPRFFQCPPNPLGHHPQHRQHHRYLHYLIPACSPLDPKPPRPHPNRSSLYYPAILEFCTCNPALPIPLRIAPHRASPSLLLHDPRLHRLTMLAWRRSGERC